MPQLPFADLNLRYNPFGELDREARAAVAEVDVGDLAARLGSPGTVVQLVGPCGRGKTTHLLALAAALPHATYVRADTDGHRRLPDTEVLLLDEADRVGFFHRRRLWKRARSLAIATHRDLSWQLPRRAVHTVAIGGLDLPRLTRVVRRRIEAARRASGPLPMVPEPVLAALLAEFGDDLRAIEWALYERFQQRQEACLVQV